MKWYIITLITILLFISGCDHFFKKPSPLSDLQTAEKIEEATEKINVNATSIKENSENIKKEATSIKEETVKVEGKVPSENKKDIDPHLASIKESSNKIIEDSHKIDLATVNVVSATDVLKISKDEIKILTDKINQLEKTTNKAIEERDKAIADKNSSIHRLLRWVIVGCIGGISVFVVIFLLYGSKLGLLGAGTSALTLGIASFVDAYMGYIAIFGGLIILICVGILIYHIIIRKRAFKEVVDTVEVAQENMDEEIRNKLFGGVGETGIMDAVQSPETMKLVKEEKKKMPKLWYYAKVHKINNLSNDKKA